MTYELCLLFSVANVFVPLDERQAYGYEYA